MTNEYWLTSNDTSNDTSITSIAGGNRSRHMQSQSAYIVNGIQGFNIVAFSIENFLDAVFALSLRLNEHTRTLRNGYANANVNANGLMVMVK